MPEHFIVRPPNILMRYGQGHGSGRKNEIECGQAHKDEGERHCDDQ